MSLNVDTRTVLSLCAGIGGIDLGLRLALPTSRAVCYVEVEATAAAILAARFADGTLDPAPIWSDLRTFDGGAWRGCVDILTSGYPCQPFSVAGRMRGEDDPRHLWPHVARIIRECEPNVVFLENVGNHLRLGFREVAGELREMGYRVEAGLFTAEEIGAPHRRERLFCLARLENAGHSGSPSAGAAGESSATASKTQRSGEAMAYAERSRRTAAGLGRHEYAGRESEAGRGELAYAGGARYAESECGALRGTRREIEGRATPEFCPPLFPPGPGDIGAWRELLAECPEIEPAVCGSSARASSRVDRLRALGNSVVPLVAAHAYRTLRGRFDWQ